MIRIVGSAKSESAIVAHVASGILSLVHGQDEADGTHSFVAIVNEKRTEAFSVLDRDPMIKLLPTALDDPADATVVRAMLGKKHALATAVQAPKVRDVHAAMHAKGFTHLFDPRLG